MTDMTQDTGTRETAKKATQGRAHNPCTQTYSSPRSQQQLLTAQSRPTAAAFTSSQKTPVWAAPGPAHHGQSLLPVNLAPRVCTSRRREHLPSSSLDTWPAGDTQQSVLGGRFRSNWASSSTPQLPSYMLSANDIAPNHTSYQEEVFPASSTRGPSPSRWTFWHLDLQGSSLPPPQPAADFWAPPCRLSPPLSPGPSHS